MKAKKPAKDLSHMSRAEKEAELLRLADLIGRPKALRIIRKMQEEELRRRLSVN